MAKSGAAHSRRTSRHQAFIAEDTAAKGPEKRRALARPPKPGNPEVTHGILHQFGQRNRYIIDARLATGDTRESLLKKAAAIAPLTLRERKQFRG